MGVVWIGLRIGGGLGADSSDSDAGGRIAPPTMPDPFEVCAWAKPVKNKRIPTPERRLESGFLMEILGIVLLANDRPFRGGFE